MALQASQIDEATIHCIYRVWVPDTYPCIELEPDLWRIFLRTFLRPGAIFLRFGIKEYEKDRILQIFMKKHPGIRADITNASDYDDSFFVPASAI